MNPNTTVLVPWHFLPEYQNPCTTFNKERGRKAILNIQCLCTMCENIAWGEEIH